MYLDSQMCSVALFLPKTSHYGQTTLRHIFNTAEHDIIIFQQICCGLQFELMACDCESFYLEYYSLTPVSRGLKFSRGVGGGWVETFQVLHNSLFPNTHHAHILG